MARFLWICLGGAVGTGGRYLLCGWADRLVGAAFPAGTLAVNVVGSFLLALIAHVGVETDLISPTVRYALTTGVMGGFTTYSTFNHETLELYRDGAFGQASLNVAVTVLACLAAGVLGLATGRAIAGR